MIIVRTPSVVCTLSISPALGIRVRPLRVKGLTLIPNARSASAWFS